MLRSQGRSLQGTKASDILVPSVDEVLSRRVLRCWSYGREDGRVAIAVMDVQNLSKRGYLEANGEVKVNTRTFEDQIWKRAPTVLCKDIGG